MAQADLMIRPVANDNIVRKIVEKLYGLKVKHIRELNSYDDKNYRIICDEKSVNEYVNEVASEGYVLKITNSLDSQNCDYIAGQNEMMLYLNQHHITCPRPICNLKGSYYSLEKLRDEDNTIHIIRLLLYCSGEILYNGKITPALLYNVGHFTAQLENTLREFVHPSYYEHTTPWSLLAVPKLRDYIYVVKNNDDKIMIEQVINRFEKDIIDNVDKFARGMIHGDLNEQNILINTENNKVIGIIDFGDTQYTCLIFELFIVLCYMIIQAGDIRMGKYVLDGFLSLNSLTVDEKRALKTGVCARICQSLVIGAYTHLNEPQNNYLLITQKSGWKVLRELWSMSDEDILNVWGL